MAERWRRCSACKGDIGLGSIYWVCNVSTCNRKRTGLVFCSVDCWEIHLPTERHREAWAVEQRAPTRPDPPPSAPGASSRSTTAPRRAPSAPVPPTSARPAPAVLIRKAGAPEGSALRQGTAARVPPPPPSASGATDQEILVVASRLKAYVRERSGFNTSDRVLPLLSEALRRICDESIRNARAAERLTVLARDVPRD